MTWHIELEIQSWVYNQVMGAPHPGITQHIGELAPRVVFIWGWR